MRGETVLLTPCLSNGMAWCTGMRELLRAVMKAKPIITMVEPEKKHGGVTYEDARESLEHAVDKFEEWGLAAEMRQWQQEEHLGAIPTARELINVLFQKDGVLVLEWNRVRVRAHARKRCHNTESVP